MAGKAICRAVRSTGCRRCLLPLSSSSQELSLYRSSINTKRKLHDGLVPDKMIQRSMAMSSQSFIHDYFSANNTIDRGWLRNATWAVWRTNAEPPKADSPASPTLEEQMESDSLRSRFQVDVPPKATSVSSSPPVVNIATARIGPNEEEVLPHRRRKPRKETIINSAETSQNEAQLPLDASSQLATAAISLPKSATLRRRFATYLSLTKPRLSFLILLTTTSAYSLYPIPEILSNSAAPELHTTLSTSTLTFLFLTTGTFLSCACANTLNMLFEPKYDALMTRTRNRPLVRNLISKRAALVFAVLCGASGLLLLDVGTNHTVAGLSALNIFLYAGVYTPMKRISAANTWVGAIVGGIPPLMGWCAAAGQTATVEHHSWQDLLFSESSIGGWLLASLLFAWQFPHFMSLSHTIRDDYRNAGHKMLAWTNPARNARVALRYSLAMFPICAGLYWAGLVNQGFLAISTACNVWMTREAVRFWRKQGAGGSARGLFWASVWQLPLVLVGALVCKSRIWDGLFGSQEAVSIYDDQENVFPDAESLGTQTVTSLGKKGLHDINLAMMGFKRPS
jgi:heme o synthase